MKLQKRWFGLVGVLIVVAVVVAACGGITSTPEAAMDKANSEVMAQVDSDEAMIKDAPDETVMKDESDESTMDDASDETMMKDESDESTMDDASDETMMKDDSDESTMDDASDETMMKGDSDESTMDGASDETMMKDDSQAMIDLPDWFHAELTDVRSGEAFSLADYGGKVVLVETMAIWCSNCLRQQKEVKSLHEGMGTNDGFVTVVLDVDPNEDAEDLKSYADRNGFDWTYAVAPREVARQIGQLYGNQFLNPPSTPMLIVDRHGQVHPLPFGIKRAESLQEALEPFLSAGM